MRIYSQMRAEPLAMPPPGGMARNEAQRSDVFHARLISFALRKKGLAPRCGAAARTGLSTFNFQPSTV